MKLDAGQRVRAGESFVNLGELSLDRCRRALAPRLRTLSFQPSEITPDCGTLFSTCASAALWLAAIFFGPRRTALVADRLDAVARVILRAELFSSAIALPSIVDGRLETRRS